jgi:hypothetical protein
MILLILFLTGVFNEDTCFIGEDGDQYCDVQVGLGLEIPTGTSKAFEVAICGAW